jgi:hypothetical protein
MLSALVSISLHGSCVFYDPSYINVTVSLISIINRVAIIFGFQSDGKPDKLHWCWDIGLQKRAVSRIEGCPLVQTVAYGDLSNENPGMITPAYEQQADPVIQLEKAAS